MRTARPVIWRHVMVTELKSDISSQRYCWRGSNWTETDRSVFFLINILWFQKFITFQPQIHRVQMQSSVHSLAVIWRDPKQSRTHTHTCPNASALYLCPNRLSHPRADFTCSVKILSYTFSIAISNERKKRVSMPKSRWIYPVPSARRPPALLAHVF